MRSGHDQIMRAHFRQLLILTRAEQRTEAAEWSDASVYSVICSSRRWHGSESEPFLRALCRRNRAIINLWDAGELVRSIMAAGPVSEITARNAIRKRHLWTDPAFEEKLIEMAAR